MKPRLLLVALVALVCTAAAAVVASAGTGRSHDRHHRSSYEVWLVDQEDKGSLGAGTLHIFDGRELARDAASAVPETISLAGDVADHVRGEDRNVASAPAHARFQRRRR